MTFPADEVIAEGSRHRLAVAFARSRCPHIRPPARAALTRNSARESGRGFALGLQFGPADGQSRSSRLESWGSEGRSMAQKLWAQVMARAQCAPLKAHGGIAKAARGGCLPVVGDYFVSLGNVIAAGLESPRGRKGLAGRADRTRHRRDVVRGTPTPGHQRSATCVPARCR